MAFKGKEQVKIEFEEGYFCMSGIHVGDIYSHLDISVRSSRRRLAPDI